VSAATPQLPTRLHHSQATDSWLTPQANIHLYVGVFNLLQGLFYVQKILDEEAIFAIFKNFCILAMFARHQQPFLPLSFKSYLSPDKYD
jgi:hypothetical protein